MNRNDDALRLFMVNQRQTISLTFRKQPKSLALFAGWHGWHVIRCPPFAVLQCNEQYLYMSSSLRRWTFRGAEKAASEPDPQSTYLAGSTPRVSKSALAMKTHMDPTWIPHLTLVEEKYITYEGMLWLASNLKHGYCLHTAAKACMNGTGAFYLDICTARTTSTIQGPSAHLKSN